MRRFLTLLVTLLVFGAGSALGQTKQISGKVTSAGDNQPIPGVSVLIKGTNIGVSTSIDGNYILKNVPANAKSLVFRFVGYQSIEKPIVGNQVDAVLTSENQKIDELIVIGYGTVKKSELTGAVSSVKTKELSNQIVSSTAQALQGKVSGVQVVSTSGRAGDETQISLRGNGSLNASTSVLYVIDGVPSTSIKSLSPSDIESIDVLKDAASAAIYGSRASNGVVLVTTKRGSYNKKTVVDFNATYGIQELVKKPSLLNPSEYKLIHDEALQNYKADIASGLSSSPKDPKTLTPLVLGGANTDWINEILRGTSSVQNYQLGITGGSANSKFYLGGSIFNQQGLVKMDDYQKYTGKLNFEHIIYDALKIGVNSNFAYSEQIPLVEDNDIYQPWSAALHARPDQPIYDKNGKVGTYTFINPFYAFERKVNDKWMRLGTTAYLDWTLYKGLIWHSSVGGNINSQRYNRFDAPSTKRGKNGSGVPTGFGDYQTQYNRDYIVENTITYSGTYDKLRYTALLGHSFQKSEFEESEVKGEGFPSDDLTWLTSAGTINNGTSGYYNYGLDSYFGRLQLGWDNKYNVMYSARRDGSSKFTKDNRYGTFHAFSAGWTVSNEDFFKNDIMSTLKVKASYGETGNQDGISSSSGQNLLGSGYNYNEKPGLAILRIFNPDLKWEKTKSSNFGVDMGFLNDRINLSVNVYNKETEDLLYNMDIPQESGFKTMQVNAGSIKNRGIEIDLNTKIFDKSEFKWDLNCNFSYNSNEVTDLAANKDYYTTGFVSIVKKGESLGSFFLINSLGVANEKVELKDSKGVVKTTIQPGDMIYEDVNGDGLISEADRQVFSGGIAPIFGGVTNSFSYKGFDLRISTQYSIGKKVYAMYKEGGTGAMNGGSVGYPSFSNNMITDILDRWTPSHMNTDVPRLHMDSKIVSWNMQRSSRFLEDADYLRISDITLGYNFNAFKIPYITNVRMFLQARNAFTFTKYKGLDPETQYVDPERENNKVTAGVDQAGIPNAKVFSIGLNLSF